ncbi:MAG: type II secretion system minor pseudopilin GspI [Gammaproteobacteria bacterium]
MNGKGFTLVEILVAMAVLAVGLLAALTAVSQLTVNESYLRDRTLATWLARNQVLEVQLQGEWPQPGQASGALEYAGREWRWRQRITQTPEADMRRLDLEVWLPGAEGEPLARLTGFLERP